MRTRALLARNPWLEKWASATVIIALGIGPIRGVLGALVSAGFYHPWNSVSPVTALQWIQPLVVVAAVVLAQSVVMDGRRSFGGLAVGVLLAELGLYASDVIWRASLVLDPITTQLPSVVTGLFGDAMFPLAMLEYLSYLILPVLLVIMALAGVVVYVRGWRPSGSRALVLTVAGIAAFVVVVACQVYYWDLTNAVLDGARMGRFGEDLRNASGPNGLSFESAYALVEPFRAGALGAGGLLIWARVESRRRAKGLTSIAADVGGQA